MKRGETYLAEMCAGPLRAWRDRCLLEENTEGGLETGKNKRLDTCGESVSIWFIVRGHDLKE